MKYHNYLENLFGSKVRIKLTRTLYKFKDKKIISLALFGSLAKGEEDFNSDIDLLIITKNKKLASQISEKCNLEIIDKFGNVLMPYILNKNEFKKSNIRED